MGFVLKSGSGGGIVGRLIFSAFGLFFAFIGTHLVKQEWNTLQEAKQMQQWVRIPCRIESSEIRDEGEDFRLEVVYSYEINGNVYRATRYGRNEHLTRETMGEIDREHKRYAVGTSDYCHYSPADPSDAVLEVPSRRSALTSFGLTFLFPAFGLLFATLPWLAARKRKPEISITESSPPKKARSGKWPMVLFGAFFAIMGLAMLKPLFLTPMQKSRDARTWSTVEAVVISSKVKSHTSDDSTTYSPYIAYRYTVDGEEYLGDQYSFFGGSSSGRDAKAVIVRQYPAGHTFQLYFNPDNPAESVINRELSNARFVGLIPLVFFIAGIAIMVSAFRAKKQKLADRQTREHIVVLKSPSPVVNAAVLILFTVIWNTAVYFMFTTGASLFMILIFGFFGIVTLIASIHAILAIFNPRAEVEITPGNIRPGTSVAMRWRMTGRTERIEALTVSLECVRVTTETSGHGKNRSRRVVKTPLFSEELLRTDSRHEISQGTLQFRIPEDQPPSAPGNAYGVEWRLEFHGSIVRWPDTKQEMPFTVYP